MKVLLVNGSPHKEGTTFHALTEAAETLKKEGIEAEIVWIGNKPIGGCIGCFKCGELKKCVFDDAVNELREKVREADGFIFGTPVHYAAAAGNITSFMDRLFYSEMHANGAKNLRLKPAAAVVCARRGGCSAAFDQMNKYFTILEMPIVSACYWNMVHGAFGDQCKQDLEGMRNMRVLARNMAYMLRCQQAAREAGVPLPEQEPGIFTNFIR